uniref:Coat protein n=1 Tax=Geladintestivirus 1 TaxID=3233133 RepID=A0AAU8MIA3_9CAUD
MKKGNLSFASFNAVISGQKSNVVDATPMLIANSTKGKFTVTAPVTKYLGVAAGENIMFVNNIDGLMEAIEANTPEIQAAADAIGADLTTTEGQKKFIAEYTIWAIAKGQILYNGNGTEKKSTVRMTVEDKKAYIAKHGEEIAEVNKDMLLDRLGVEDASIEELIAAISVDDIELLTTSLSGSKTATTSNATGVGLQLGFTDNNIWNQMKSDIEEEERTKINRKYNVLLDDAFTVKFNNGYEFVDVKCVPVEFVADEAPVNRLKKAE